MRSLISHTQHLTISQRFWRELLKIIDTEEDALLAYRVCKSCVSKIESAGSVVRPTKALLYMI
jgi:CRISPR/Cas system-associated endoribonuclease Cas2